MKINRNERFLFILVSVVLSIVLGVSGCSGIHLLGKKEVHVGKEIKADDITEFYFTRSSSTNPPEYQRFHFYIENGNYQFSHEKREGDHWPLTEKDVTVSGVLELEKEDWGQFLSYLTQGGVSKRTENTSTGNSGPFLYLYSQGKYSEYQEFRFRSYDVQKEFETYCYEKADAAK